MRRLPFIFVAAATMLWPGALAAAECEIFDAGADSLVTGECTLDSDGNSEIITLPERRVVFVLLERQGRWATGTLDGRPASRYEIDRSTFSYATQDLKLFVDRREN